MIRARKAKKVMKIPYNQWKLGGVDRIPHIQDCIKYIESCGYKYSHRSKSKTYVFHPVRQGSSPKELSFYLHEIRRVYKYGF
jgi:hypothetical protein